MENGDDYPEVLGPTKKSLSGNSTNSLTCSVVQRPKNLTGGEKDENDLQH